MNGNVYSMAVGMVAVGINVIIGRLTTARDSTLPPPSSCLSIDNNKTVSLSLRGVYSLGGKKERKGTNTFRFVSFFQGNYRGGGGDVLDQPVFRLATSSRAPL